MPMGTPYVSVECDNCGDIADGEAMTQLAGGSWDERGPRDTFKRLGWKFDGDLAICPECVSLKEIQKQEAL